MATNTIPKLSKSTAEGLRVLDANNGNTVLGRSNSVTGSTIHHNSLKALVAAGLATDTVGAKGARKIKLTAAGRKALKTL